MDANRIGQLRRNKQRWTVTVCVGAIVCLITLGCSSDSTDMFDEQEQASETASPGYDVKPWAEVLRNHVRSGLVDYHSLAASPGDLEAFRQQIAFTGPESTPELFGDAQAATAYYINAYNACAFAVVLEEDIPATLHDVTAKRLEYDYRFRIDGRIVTLKQLREKAIEASAGNARVLFALCDAAHGSPQIQDKPFRAATVQDQLITVAARAMDDPDMVRVDHENQRLWIGLPVWTQRQALIDVYTRETGSASGRLLDCLMHLASGMRRDYFSRAAGYDQRLMPFDRALNVTAN